MSRPQIIRTEAGETLVVIPLTEYQRLMNRAGEDAEDALEEEFIRRVVAESNAAIIRGDDVLLPESVWEEIESGGNAVRVLRKYRALTQADLAERASITQAFLSEIESGRKVAATKTLKSVAKALAVPLSVLIE